MRTIRLKYVICKLKTGVEYAIIFSEKLVHSQILEKSLIKISSAGFCVIDFDDMDLNVEVLNEPSTSLNLLPRIEIDETIIRNTLLGSIRDYLMF